MKFAYLTNKKNDYIYEILSCLEEMEYYSDFKKIDKEVIGTYDAVIINGNIEVIKQMDLCNHNNVIIIPDFEDIEDMNLLTFIRKNNVKVLCLSYKIYNKLSKYNQKCFYIQYYPKPIRNLYDDVDISGKILIEDYNSKNKSVYDYLLRKYKEIKIININAKNVEEQELIDLRLSQNNNLELMRYELNDNTFKELLDEIDIYIPAKNEMNFRFLEAMSRGVCVIAPNSEYYNEYISNGTNGYVFELDNSYPLEFNDLKELKNRTIESAHDGYETWSRNYKNLVDFISMPIEEMKSYPLNYIWDNKGKEITNEGETGKFNPKVSVVTVCRNAEKVIEKTIKSVINQDYNNYEYIILDGLSEDNTINIIKKYENKIAYWHSRRDDGIYPTMIDSLQYITGDFVIFMNADDEFVSNDALSRTFKRVSENVDIVFGHHIYRTEEDGDIIHVANDFNSTWYRLKNGYLNFDWLGGIPCHQTVSVRKQVLETLKFDLNYKIAADHEFYFRAKKNGYTFFNSNEVVSIYIGGGISANRAELCVQEWQQIARTYGIREAADYFYDNFPGRNSGKNNSKIWIDIKKKLKNIELLKKIGTKLNVFNKETRAQRVYWDTFKDGFKLFKQGLPSFIEKTEGLSDSEGWGRWTTDKKVSIKYSNALPNKFDLIIDGYAFGKNINSEVTVKVGKYIQRLVMKGEPAKEYNLTIENDANSRVIEITIPHPNSPNSLFGDSCSDKRKLGLAISKISIIDLN